MLLDWHSFQLMVFDVDGTLYDQKKLRRRMAGALLRDAIGAGSVGTISILRMYRKWREDLAQEEREGFEDVLTDRLAARYGRSRAQIEAIVFDWMESRPLPLLKPHRRPGVKELFDKLRARRERRSACCPTIQRKTSSPPSGSTPTWW